MAIEADTQGDPIDTFLEEQAFHGRSDRTVEAYSRVLRDFESFVCEDDRFDTNEVADADRRACMAWVHSLRGNLAESTIATYASYVHRFYSYMGDVGVFDANPMSLVVAEMDESIDVDPTRRDVNLEEMREFVDDVVHPLERAIVLTLLKTGIRVGELCNLDLRDCNVDRSDLGFNEDVRAQLSGRHTSLYVDADAVRGRSINGEVRTASNKRKRSTIVPVDDELRQYLRAWLAIRPRSNSPAEALFVSTGEQWGQRLEPATVRYIVEKHARERGWYHTGGGAAENVTPHYFRHFFTTHMRDRIGDRGVVKYLRGDVADDILDTYTHNWGDRVRRVYLENVYQLL